MLLQRVANTLVKDLNTVNNTTLVCNIEILKRKHTNYTANFKLYVTKKAKDPGNSVAG